MHHHKAVMKTWQLNTIHGCERIHPTKQDFKQALHRIAIIFLVNDYNAALTISNKMEITVCMLSLLLKILGLDITSRLLLITRLLLNIASLFELAGTYRYVG